VLSAYTTVTPPGWYVFADLPQSEAFAPLYASLERTGVLVIAGLVLAVLVSVVLARRMVTPIRALQAGAARIAGGALDQPIDVHTGDELEALADEFNRMTARLHQSYADLELKVEERTRELSLALSQVEAQRVALELASRHKSAFLAAMSHELRTPLNAVIGFSEVLLARMFGELNEQQADYMHDILTSGQHLLALINDILDLAKVEAGRMELVCTPFSLPDTLELSLSMVRERVARKALSMSLTVDPAVGLITADERKVTQVLVNLVTNAVKFTPEGGRIEITAGVEEEMAVIAVHDTGIGIAPDEQESIFEEFRQAGAPGEREGTGLGLGLSKQFVVLHGGRISVESAVGCGSTFTVHLPIQPVGMAGGRCRAGGRGKSMSGERVLVVEDNEKNRKLVRDVLQFHGYEVLVAGTAAEGIALARTEQPSLILLDIQLPDLDGMAALRLLRAEPETAGIPIVAVTAYAMSGDRERLLGAGFTDYLAKPLDIKTFPAAVRRVCERTPEVA